MAKQEQMHMDSVPPASAQPLFSVVICTHNRAALLKDALQTVCMQTLAPACFDVLVVDNGSTDDTRQVVADFSRHYAHVRYQWEPLLGLAHARNCGWQNAQGVYVVYLDDDCLTPPTWLDQAQQVIADQAPPALIGPFYAYHASPPPPWWQPDFDRFHGQTYAAAGPLPTAHSLWGVSLFIRRDLLAQLVGFDPALGMQGQRLGYEEDSDWGRRFVHHTGQAVYYDPRLWVYHLVRREKLSLRAMIRELFVRSRFYYRAQPQRRQANRFKVGLQGIKASMQLFYYLGRALLRNRYQTPYLQQYLYGHAGFRRAIWQLGRVAESYRPVGRVKRWRSCADESTP